MNGKKLFKLLGCLLLLSTYIYASPDTALDMQKKAEEMTKNVFRSVVKVEVRNGMRKVATGVVIDKAGHIVTTALITPKEGECSVMTAQGERVEAELLGMDAETHLAVIKAKEGKWTPIDWGRKEDIGPGSNIWVVSFSPEDRAAVTSGIVSSVGKQDLRLNVWVVQGASGSPVVDENGRLVGVIRGAYVDEITFDLGARTVVSGQLAVSRVEAPSSALAKAIPVDVVEKVAEEIKETGKVMRGWLGVGILPHEDGGVLIESVQTDSPAEEAGLEEGDILLKIEGRDITDNDMLLQEIRMRKPGDRITLRIKRDGKERNIEVKLGEYTQTSMMQEFESRFPQLFRMPRGEAFRPAPFPEEPRTFQFLLDESKYIGVYLQDLNPELAEYFGAEQGSGLLITRLSKDGPAEKAGIKVGDVILSADGKDMKNQEELIQLIQKKDVGEKIKLELIREKKRMSVEVAVAEDKSRGRRFFPVAGSLFTDPERLFGENLKERAGLWEGRFDNFKDALQRYDKDVKSRYKQVLERYSDPYKKKWDSLFKESFETYRKQAEESKKKKKVTFVADWYRCIKV